MKELHFHNVNESLDLNRHCIHMLSKSQLIIHYDSEVSYRFDFLDLNFLSHDCRCESVCSDNVMELMPLCLMEADKQNIVLEVLCWALEDFY